MIADRTMIRYLITINYLPGEPTTKNRVSIEHLLNSSPAKHNWSDVSIRKKGGPFDFFDEASSLAPVEDAAARRRNSDLTKFITAYQY